MREKPFAITLDVGSSKANHTGSWRTERPVYHDFLPPCNDACPAGENIQQWLYHAEAGGYEAAWRQIMADNPFPAVMGRVCYRPCETACNRAQLDQAVGINSVERFLGDEAIRENWRVEVPSPPSGRRVLVVGSGPAGLSAAYQLTLLGHQVTVHDANPLPGGMMRYGIPEYRLPRTVLDAEIQRIVDLGVEMRMAEAIFDIGGAMSDGQYDAAFLALGAQLGRRTYLPAGDSARILDAISMLRDVETHHPPELGRRVVVYGGGNTAMDAARTARRLGAADAVVVYRRTRDRMPAEPAEIEDAVAEGVQLRWLSTIAQADEGRVVVEKMRLDDSGFPQPTGEYDELGADTVILAIGQRADLSLVERLADVEWKNDQLTVGADLMTGHPGVFAGGDVVPTSRTVTSAIGHGKKAARHIDAWLRGQRLELSARHPIAASERINSWYFSDAPATVRPKLDLARRISTFDEVVGGLDTESALFEARRCLSCGNCFECDNCYGVCPDNAVVKLGPGSRYTIDLDYCKGCGICVEECPCGAISMEPEEN
ncbi:NAD(P)-binding protein [Fodinicola acaciae]|uniref:NAD(P)-binding protein n=1 Tax=Fodinicola acaciae TaxID=2681555 RepID=UPI0013D33723|nr:NAD(P)-binding protein [Fodinicola acaciae]